MSSNPVISGCGFHHVAVQTTDYEGTKRFYQETLGFRLVHEWAMDVRQLCLLDVGDGGCIEVVGVPAAAVADEPGKQAPMLHLALRCDDVDAAIARARAAGCEVTVAPKDVLLGDMPARVGFFRGPNGELIEFFHAR